MGRAGRPPRRETRDPRDTCWDHAAAAYVSGEIDVDEYLERMEMSPDEYVSRYRVPPPPPPPAVWRDPGIRERR